MKLLLEPALQRQLAAINKNPGGAYFFSGPEACGKFTAAWQLAGEITGRSNPKLAPANHPDAVLVAPSKQSIGIAQIHALEKQLRLKPHYTGGHKVVVVDAADKMTVAAQNAFLKTLEEPPAYVTLILVAARTERLLPTIRSRCKLVRFTLPASKRLNSYLSKNFKVDAATAASLNVLAAGRPGVAIRLAREEEYRAQFSARRALAVRLLDADTFGRLKLAAELLREDVEQTEELARHLLAELRQRLHEAEGEGLAHLQAGLKSTTLYLKQLEMNVNRKLATNNLMLNLPHA